MGITRAEATKPRRHAGRLTSAVALVGVLGLLSGPAHAATGKVLSWGFNKYGQLGLGVESPVSNSFVPLAVPVTDFLVSGAEDISAGIGLAAGGLHSLAVG